MKTLTLEKLKQHVSYDPETGLFTSVANRLVGEVVGHKDAKGYMRICVDSVTYFAHRLAWLWMTGEMPKSRVDHENQNPEDNRWLNLRMATAGQNVANSGLMKTNKLGAKGVYKSGKRFAACIMVNKRNVHLGSHDTIDEAAHAYNKGAIQHFGDFAVLNPVGI